jgi:hypothetical protein
VPPLRRRVSKKLLQNAQNNDDMNAELAFEERKARLEQLRLENEAKKLEIEEKRERLRETIMMRRGYLESDLN